VGEPLLVPEMATVKAVRQVIGDTVLLKVAPGHGGRAYLPGQFMELSVLGVGECPISITSTPTRPGRLEFAVRDVGRVTHALHNLDVGDRVGLRGPFGNGFPTEALRGRDLYIIAGGIGLAPLRSLINFLLDNRRDYGRIDIVYGARTPELLCFVEEYDSWRRAPRTGLHLTVDAPAPGWAGKVGFVPQIVNQLALPPGNRTVVVCGPPIMIKYALADLDAAGYEDEHILTTLELKMKCGVGKCGRCNLGHRYVCRDGPVFRLSEIKALHGEF
jgi:sulfhydrogenase subunit gamma (sulfur reductase)